MPSTNCSGVTMWADICPKDKASRFYKLRVWVPFWDYFTTLYKKSCNTFSPKCVYLCGPHSRVQLRGLHGNAVTEADVLAGDGGYALAGNDEAGEVEGVGSGDGYSFATGWDVAHGAQRLDSFG